MAALRTRHRHPERAAVRGDLHVLRTAVFANADDLLPDRAPHARRSATTAQIVTGAVAQAIIDMPSERELVAVAAQRVAASSVRECVTARGGAF